MGDYFINEYALPCWDCFSHSVRQRRMWQHIRLQFTWASATLFCWTWHATFSHSLCTARSRPMSCTAQVVAIQHYSTRPHAPVEYIAADNGR